MSGFFTYGNAGGGFPDPDNENPDPCTDFKIYRMEKRIYRQPYKEPVGTDAFIKRYFYIVAYNAAGQYLAEGHNWEEVEKRITKRRGRAIIARRPRTVTCQQPLAADGSQTTEGG